MSKVRIPPVLRAQAENNKQVEIDGETVGAVITSLVERFPGLREQLLNAEGELNRFVNVYVSDQDIRYLQELATPVAAHDTVVILPAMAGGDLAGADLAGGDLAGADLARGA